MIPAAIRSDAGSISSDREAIKPSAVIMSWVWVVVLACVPVYRVGIASLGSHLPDLIFLLLIGCVAFGHFRPSAVTMKWRLAVLFIPLAALFSGVNSSLSASLLLAMKFVVLLWFAPMVFSYYMFATPSFVERAVAGFVGLQTLSAIAGLLQLTGMSVLGMVANSGRANGLSGHPNILGLMCVVAILIGLGMKPLTHRNRIVRIFVVAINSAALIGTGSISSMIAMVVSLGVLVLVLRSTAKFVITFFMLSVVVLTGAAIAGIEASALMMPVESRVQEVTGESDGVASFDIRQRTYSFALDSISSDPFSGVGLDGANQGTFDGVTVVHNYLLRAWFQGGIFLFASFSLITLVLLGFVVRAIITSRNAVQASIVIAVLTFGLTSAFYEQQQYWFIIVFALASFDQANNERPESLERVTDAGPVRS